MNALCELFLVSLQGMSATKFKEIFDRKRHAFEEKVNVDAGLLSKLEDSKIITRIQRSEIEVTVLFFAKIYKTVKQNQPKQRTLTWLDFTPCHSLWSTSCSVSQSGPLLRCRLYLLLALKPAFRIFVSIFLFWLYLGRSLPLRPYSVHSSACLSTLSSSLPNSSHELYLYLCFILVVFYIVF